MSNLTICRFKLNNFNYSLLFILLFMAPSFANGGNLFVLLIIQRTVQIVTYVIYKFTCNYLRHLKFSFDHYRF